MQPQNPRQEFEIPHVTFNELNEMALKFLNAQMPQFLTIPMAFDVDKMIEVLELPMVECELPLDNIKGMILFSDSDVSTPDGITTYKRYTILLSPKLRNDFLESRFTKAHEAAHWLIFDRYKSRITEHYACSKEEADRDDVLFADKCIHYLESHPNALEELHTNVLTCMVMMPRTTFVPIAKIIMQKHGFSDVYYSSEEYESEFDKVISELAEIYLVPDFAVNLYLQILGLYIES